MARGGSFYYSADPSASIGASLATALFGDPELRQKQQEFAARQALYDAQTGEASSHGRLYDSQATGQDGMNAASRSLPDLIARLSAPQPVVAPQPTGPVDPLAPLPDAPRPVDPVNAFHAGIPALIAALAQAKGDKVDLSQTVGALSAFTGNDGLAREGMVAQGQTPGATFALTPERADAISARDAGEDLSKAVTVEGIQSADRRRGQDIESGDRRRGQNIESSDRRRGQDVSGGGKGGGTVALDGFNPGGINDGPWARKQPGYAGSNGRYAAFTDLASGEAAQRRLLSNYISNGYDTPQKIADRWAPAKDGNDPVAYAQTIARQLGIGVNDRLTPGDVDRFQTAQGRAENVAYRGTGKGKATASGKAPSAPSQQLAAQLDGEIASQSKDRGVTLSPRVTTAVKSLAIKLVQQSGNPVAAVRDALNAARDSSRRDDLHHGSGPQMASNDVVNVSSPEEAAKLRPGTKFRTPDGRVIVRQ